MLFLFSFFVYFSFFVFVFLNSDIVMMDILNHNIMIVSWMDLEYYFHFSVSSRSIFQIISLLKLNKENNKNLFRVFNIPL